jgi:hypothetical protein
LSFSIITLLLLCTIGSCDEGNQYRWPYTIAFIGLILYGQSLWALTAIVTWKIFFLGILTYIGISIDIVLIFWKKLMNPPTNTS